MYESAARELESVGNTTDEWQWGVKARLEAGIECLVITC